MKKKDYLKYFRLARHYLKVKYKLGLIDLEMLLYLYSEGYFGKQVFDEYKQVMKCEKGRFDRLMNEGWIITFREKQKGRKAIYELSYKAKRAIANLYNILEGGMISTNKNYNPMFEEDATYMDKVYRNAIKKRNKAIQQQRHPFRK